jgi:hypothetical protein
MRDRFPAILELSRKKLSLGMGSATGFLHRDLQLPVSVSCEASYERYISLIMSMKPLSVGIGRRRDNVKNNPEQSRQTSPEPILHTRTMELN